jgi:hypothetical protein
MLTQNYKYKLEERERQKRREERRQTFKFKNNVNSKSRKILREKNQENHEKKMRKYRAKSLKRVRKLRREKSGKSVGGCKSNGVYRFNGRRRAGFEEKTDFLTKSYQINKTVDTNYGGSGSQLQRKNFEAEKKNSKISAL